MRISGVILAGGRARRMNQQDKGLVLYRGQPLVKYALDALVPTVEQVLINANRNLSAYKQFGYPVVSDLSNTFDGPLAGVLTALHRVEDGVLIVMPCDCPLMSAMDLQKLRDGLLNSEAEIATVFDGERVQNAFLALKTGLKNSLADYLDSGGRKISNWMTHHAVTEIDFSAVAEHFLNLNTVTELIALETRLSALQDNF